jgi:DNA helicase-2/ATP-dependent DNA helicase PcrA
MQWPLDPLGVRAEGVLRAADAVRQAMVKQHDESLDAEAEAEATDAEAVVQLLLAERREVLSDHEDRAGEASLPERITASTFHEFVEDPAVAERNRLRPIPQRPYRRTRIGNRFHEWVERRATTARGTALPLAGLEYDTWEFETDVSHDPVSDATIAEHEAELQPLIEQFERSRWANLRPIEVEQEVTLPFAGRSLVCKLDAVYQFGSDASLRYEIVDWKSGRSPQTEEERKTRFFQLDLYRHAYAQWASVAPEQIDVSLFYVAEGVELQGEGSRSLAELEEIWLSAAAKLNSERGEKDPADPRR